MTSDHCHVTVQRLFKKISQIAWNVLNRLFDSWPTVAWPPTTIAWPFSDFSSKIFPDCLKRPKNVAWQSADGRVTSDHCRVTVQRLFFKNFPNCLKRLNGMFDSRLTVAWPSTTVAWPFSDFFKICSKCLKRRNNVVWQSADGSLDLQPMSRDRWATAPHTLAYVSFSFRLKTTSWRTPLSGVLRDLRLGHWELLKSDLLNHCGFHETRRVKTRWIASPI